MHGLARIRFAFFPKTRLMSYGFCAATFLSSYIHTVIIYIALCIFSFTVYAGGSDLGSPKKVRPLNPV